MRNSAQNASRLSRGRGGYAVKKSGLLSPFPPYSPLTPVHISPPSNASSLAFFVYCCWPREACSSGKEASSGNRAKPS